MTLHNNSALLKRDNKRCKAVFKTVKVFFGNDCKTYYSGVTDFYESGVRLFRLKSESVRPTKQDALQDALQIAMDNGF